MVFLQQIFLQAVLRFLILHNTLEVCQEQLALKGYIISGLIGTQKFRDGKIL